MSVSVSSHDQESLHTGVSSVAFQGLLWTQFFGAINDNVFRWFVIGIGKTQYLPENLGTLLVIGSSFFIVPYIIFASVAGWLADRFPKRKVIVACKIAEIVIMTAGVLAISLMGVPNPSKGIDPYFYLLLVVVFFMGAQSALFAPSKIGTIPELLDERTISKGNGYFNLFTLSATIIGMVGGGWLSDVTEQGQDNLWIAASVLIGLAVIGTLTSAFTRSLPAANPLARFPVTLIGENIRDLLILFRSKQLIWFALGVAFFWSIAAFVQLNIDAFAEESGSLTESDRNPLLVSVVMGIALGSVLAGYLSVGRIELGLIPLGSIGIALFALLLSFAPPDFITGRLISAPMLIGCALLFGLGCFAGIFTVPVEAYVQHYSPIEKRGAILAATNCLAFGGVLLMFGLLEVMRKPTYDGSMANIPSEFTQASLDPQEQVELNNMKQEYAAQLQAALDEPPVLLKANGIPPGLAIRPFTEHLRGEREHFRRVAITELAHQDASFRRQNERIVPFASYVTEWQPNAKYISQHGIVPDPALTLDRDAARLVKKGALQASRLPWLSSRQIFLTIAVLTIPIFFFALWHLGRITTRLFVWCLFKLLYRIRVTGLENFPQKGGGMVIANHSSWLDGAIMLVIVPRIPRTLAWAGNFSSWVGRKWADFCGVILIAGGPKSIKQGLNTAKEAIKSGEIIGIFPEGGISPSGQIRAFKPGLSKILDKEHPAPIIPAYFGETYGSLFSYSQGRTFFKWPDRIRRPLSVHFGKPIQNFNSMFELRQTVQRLSADAMEQLADQFVCPAAQLIRACKRMKFKSKVGDSTNQEEKGGTLLTRSLVLRRLLRQHVLRDSETNVGVLIPPSIGGAIVNLSLALDRRVAVNLNYTLSGELINYCIKKAGIKHVLTSRKVLEKFDFQLDCDVVYLDDLKEKVTSQDKLVSALQSYLLPANLLIRSLKLNQIKPDDLMTIVFTSGSTGVPKGVMLSQKNIVTNVQAINQVAAFVPQDTLVGILPFFHSMGFTATLWAPMICNIRGVYHFSPLEAKVIGKLIEKFQGTVIIATPTFLRSYCRRCEPAQLKTLNAVVAGAERLPSELCDEFEQKFGVRPVEGYGTTELSPIAAVNIPPSRQLGSKHQADSKEGTVGRPIPHVAAKVTDLDTGAELGPNQSGMLWIKGPNVMIGYLDMPKETADVLVDGWYKTGDVALIDDEGFIKITGRMSRFSKIGGEMVPHLKIEEVLSAFLDQTPVDGGDDQLACAITAVADEKKGERLIVLYTQTPHSIDAMLEALKAADLPNIFIPSRDSFFKVEQLPILGTGKLDLKGIKDLAHRLTASG